MPNKSTEQLIESGKCNIFSECDRKIIFFFLTTVIGPSLRLLLPYNFWALIRKLLYVCQW